jgi:signal transduction histidine kinase
MGTYQILGITVGSLILLFFTLNLLRANEILRRRIHAVKNVLTSATYFVSQASERHPADDGLKSALQSLRTLQPLLQPAENSLLYLADKQFKNPALRLTVHAQKNPSEEIMAPGKMAVLLANLAANSAEAGARNIWLTSTANGLEIRDDGPGFASLDSEGRGLKDAVAIAEECGFRLSFSSAPADNAPRGMLVRIEKGW